MMADVYQNAFLSLAALGASSMNEGFFSQRDPLTYAPCEIFESRLFGTFYAWPGSSNQYFAQCFERSALCQRGWAVQERVLARRTLYFSPILFWECREAFHDEFGLVKGVKPKQTLTKRGIWGCRVPHITIAILSWAANTLRLPPIDKTSAD
jgi:hypothetical protein